MAKGASTEKQFYRLLELLHPYLGQIVVIGGWAMYVYRVYLDPEGPMPMTTSDLDLAASGSLRVSQASLEDIFEKDGYELIPFSGTEPAITKFQKNGEPEIEFLVPLKGEGGTDSVKIQGNVVAVRKRYLDVVIDNIIKVDVSAAIKRSPESLAVRVPTPAAYLFHKGLSFTQRSDKVKKAKDLAYMFELVNNFPELRPKLLSDMSGLKHPPKWRKTFKANLSPLFEDRGSVGVQMVASQRPHPFDEMVQADVTNGAMQFNQLVLARFLEILKSV